MASEHDLEVLTQASTPFEAELIVGALRAEGLDARSTADELADEFTMSWKLIGGHIAVLVPVDQLDEAHEILSAMRPSAEDAADVEGDDDAKEGTSQTPKRDWRNSALVFLALLVVILGWMQLADLRDEMASEETDPLFNMKWERNAWVWRWKTNGSIYIESIDRDRNGIPEQHRSYDAAEVLVSAQYDNDENGRFETGTVGTVKGLLAYRWFDADEDGRSERFEYPKKDGVFQRWLDPDQDGMWDRIEFVGVEDGSVERVLVNRGADGFLPGS